MVQINGAGGNHLSPIIPDEKHCHVLENCVDVPEEVPSFPLPLQKVGISGKTVWVGLADNNGGHLPFTARIMVDLPAKRRGIHMSRIEEVITELYGKKFNSLPEYGMLLAEKVLDAQHASRVSISLNGSLPFIQQTPVSRLNSIDSIDVTFEISLTKDNPTIPDTLTVGAGIHHLTACPCTLNYNQVLFERHNDPWPQATHSQRSKTELLVSPATVEHLPAYAELIAILDEALHLSQDLLKRPDETELVLKAHNDPQFAEDTVREVARSVGKKYGKALPHKTRIQVHSTSLESIHIHDVECSLEVTLGEIINITQSIIED
jgi:MptA/FolE2 family GTP cyclohydrolase